MAFTASGIFREFVFEALANAVAYDLGGTGVDTFRAALYNDTGTPDRDATGVLRNYLGAGSAWVSTNELTSSTQWPVGGVALAAPAVSTAVGGVVMFDATDTAGSGNVTLTGVKGCLVYDDTLAGKPGICYNWFGGAQSVTAGTFTIVWNNPNGIFKITLA